MQNTIKHMDVEDKIIKSLENGPRGTLSISKKVIGPKGTKAQVNPSLYAMEKKGLLLHYQLENIHMWSLKNAI